MKQLTCFLVACLLSFTAQAKNWVEIINNDDLIVQADADSIKKIDYNSESVVSGWQRATDAVTWNNKEYASRTGQAGQWVNMLLYVDCDDDRIAVKQGSVSDYNGYTVPLKTFQNPEYEPIDERNIEIKNFFCKYN